MDTKLWLLGLLKLLGAFGIITICYLHFWFWNAVSYLEVDPLLNIFDFIVGKCLFDFSGVKSWIR